MLTLLFMGIGNAYSDKGTYFDAVKFIQYSDENTALQEIRNGHLDLYYSAIPSDLIDDKVRNDLKIFQSTGKLFSLLINPAVSTNQFNPFSIQDVRFALNYLVDRELIVDEILNGNGEPMISAYKPYDPDYLLILNVLQSFNFRHNPPLAEQIISNALEKAGAQKMDGHWLFQSKPIEITIFIRNDESIRKNIGEVLATQLEQMGFTVKKDYGDLNKAYTVVYGSDPADLKWSIYTEGYSTSSFVRYDSVTLAQMYAPWLGNMPGFGNPDYWNFKDDDIDALTLAISNGNFTSSEERSKLIQNGVDKGIRDSVRIFLACQTDQEIANKKVQGIINDFGAGITSRFTPINARSDSDTLTVGVKSIYQGAWNPIGGFADAYSRQIWSVVDDPASFKDPFTGLTIPIRETWNVSTNGPMDKDKMDVPSDAIVWNATNQEWVHVGTGVKAKSKVTFHLQFSNWHNKIPMDMNDVLYGVYFAFQWASGSTAGSKTFDSGVSPALAQSIKTLIGVRVIDSNTIEVYQDYWHFDKGEIASSAQVWADVPWEIIYASEKGVIDGKFAFSKSYAVGKNVEWLSLIVPNHAKIIQSYLEDFVKEKSIPKALANVTDPNYFISRYESSISWISQHNHAVISNGPYYLDSYSPESRTIVVKSFVDNTYPIPYGYWKKFENINLPKIEKVNVPSILSRGKELGMSLSVTPNSTVYYYLISSKGKIIDNGNMSSRDGFANIKVLPDKTMNFDLGSNDIQIFDISGTALRPDIYHTSFLVTNGTFVEPNESVVPVKESVTFDYQFISGLIIIVIIAILIMIILYKKMKRRDPAEVR